jgi:hypothetical protein
MKLKFITGLGVIVITMTLFFTTNSVNSNSTDLASLIAINTANAEGAEAPDRDECSKEDDLTCEVEYPWINNPNGNGQHLIVTLYDCEPDVWWTFADCM